MILKVLTTKRQIRAYAHFRGNGILPKLLTISEFLDRAILPPKPFVPADLRKLYFYEACKNVPLERLGIPKEFERFLKEGELIYSFLKETFLERVSLERIALEDTYDQYGEHLSIINSIVENYKSILAKKDLTDLIVLDEYAINQDYFYQFEKIEIDLQGYLTAFDKEVILQIDRPLTIELNVDRFNLDLAKKMFGIQKSGHYLITSKKDGWSLQREDLPKSDTKMELVSFDRRISQADFVFAKIEEMVQDGISPQNISVIVPDPSFKEYLEAYDDLNNLNFAMGESLIYSPLYRKLEALYRLRFLKEKEYEIKVDSDLIERFEKMERFEELKALIDELASDKEKRLIDEDLFILERMHRLEPLDIRQATRLLLDRLQERSFDNIRGGKVTVMEVLESRGIQSEGVVVVDFNEGVVPKISSEDLFLDTRLRHYANLPTTSQKENLQKHYYYQLFSGAKRVSIAYVKDDEKELSRFARELDFTKSKQDGSYYKEVLHRCKPPATPMDVHVAFDKPSELSPTSLEMLLRCPYRYYLRHIQKIKAPSGEYIGTNIHSAITKAIKERPKDAKEYHQKIMSHLIQNSDAVQRYRILVEWERPLWKFCQKDFGLLQGQILHEATQSMEFNGVRLKARADRVIKRDGKVYVYDYKTNRVDDYLKSYQKEQTKLQAEFYALLWRTQEVYFWDLRNAKLQKVPVEDAEETLKEALESIVNETVKSEESAYCKYCEYRFGCKGLI